MSVLHLPGISPLWLIAMILFLAIEAMVPGLVSIWFALGALAALLAQVLGAPFWAQISVFVMASVAALILTRPLAKKYVNSKVQPTNADMIIGKECIVQEKIDNILGSGAIVACGKTWTAVSYDDNVVIEAGSRAKVEKIIGVKTVVRPVCPAEEASAVPVDNAGSDPA